MLKILQKEKKIQISDLKTLEILGGLFLGLIFRWSGILFDIRRFFSSSAHWSGIAGPEYIILGVGYFSRLGAAFFALFMVWSGGINGGQWIASMVSLGVLEWKMRSNQVEEECCCLFLKIGRTTFFWPLASLILVGWILKTAG